MVARTLAAFAGIGYASRSPVFPGVYEEEAAEEGSAETGACDGEPASTAGSAARPVMNAGAAVLDFIKLHPDGSCGPPVVVLIKTAEGFESRREDSELEEIAPDVGVRTIETLEFYDFEYCDCPQALVDVVELRRRWRPGQVYEAPGAKALADGEDDIGESYGLTYDGFAELVVSLNAAVVVYCANGFWRFLPQRDPSLVWDGVVEIPMELEVARKTLAALAGLGYRPDLPVTPEDYVDPRQAERWIFEDDVDDDGSIRTLWFARPEEPAREFMLTARPPGEFEVYHGAALLDGLAPGVPVFVLNDNLLLGVDLVRTRTPQALGAVALLDLFLKQIDAVCEDHLGTLAV
jgi:hypothetical protein